MVRPSVVLRFTTNVEFGRFRVQSINRFVDFDAQPPLTPRRGICDWALLEAWPARPVKRMIGIGRKAVEPDVVAIAAQLDLPLG